MSDLHIRTEATDPCHPGDDWRCAAEGCGRLQCRRCDGIPNDSGLCWACFNEEDPKDAA